MSAMLDVAAAREIVFRHTRRPIPPERQRLTPGVLGQLLAEDVTADIDSPPFHKAMMDGIAVRAADCIQPRTELRLCGEVAAGVVGNALDHLCEAVRIFTGAPLPDGADAVVKEEDVAGWGSWCLLLDKPVRAGQNVMLRGSEMRAGQVVVPAGTVVTANALGLLAGVGRTSALLVPRPQVKVIATGNELVSANAVPTGAQIRNTNGPMLCAKAYHAGGMEEDFGIAPDDDDQLTALVRRALTSAHILLLSGGVSVGKYDLVPDVLKSLGVEIHFHTVRMKPGKPLLFGTLGEKLVFGLPGNPVSAAVGFDLFVRPAIDILCGRTDPGPKELRLPLCEPLRAKHDRPTYHPAVIGADSVRPLPWQGSADLRALLPANGYVVLPPGEVSFAAGDVLSVIQTG